MTSRFALILLSAIAAAAAHADWVGQGSAGYAVANGNSKSQSGNAKLDIADQIERWKHALLLEGLYSSSNSVTSANRWSARWQTDYQITDPVYVFGALRYEDDRFGAFSYQESVTGGLGYKLIDDAATKLSVEAGLGIKREQEQTLVKDASNKVVDRVDGDTTTQATATGGVKFEHVLTETTKVTDRLLIESTVDNTFAQNDLALQVSINNHFSLEVGYSFRENTSPPSGAGRTDSLTTLSLVYKLQ